MTVVTFFLQVGRDGRSHHSVVVEAIDKDQEVIM